MSYEILEDGPKTFVEPSITQRCIWYARALWVFGGSGIVKIHFQSNPRWRTVPKIWNC